MRGEHKVEELAIPVLPEEIKMAVYGPEYFGAGERCQIADNDTAAQAFLLQEKIKGEMLWKFALAFEKLSDGDDAALGSFDVVERVTWQRWKITVEQENLHNAPLMFRPEVLREARSCPSKKGHRKGGLISGAHDQD